MKSQVSRFKKKWLDRYLNIIRLSFFSLVIISVSFCISSAGKKYSDKQQKLRITEADSSLYSVPDSNRNTTIMPTQSNRSFRYVLNDPDDKYLLPDYLQEISGIAYYQKDKILCVQDEKAVIYVLGLDKKGIINKYEFGIKGDYEDIAVINQTAYVLRSDGRIFGVENFDRENRKVKEYKTPLSTKNDTEGLMYDKSSNSLFIACKGSPSVEKDHPYKGYKAIYQFDLGEMKLKKKPEILVDLNKTDSYSDVNLLTVSFLRNAKKHQLTERLASFQPSGLAIHPFYNEIYIISSTGKILVILDRKGKVLDLQDLNSDVFYQPEGICFSPSGDLFISNEGRQGDGYILKFTLHNNK